MDNRKIVFRFMAGGTYKKEEKLVQITGAQRPGKGPVVEICSICFCLSL